MREYSECTTGTWSHVQLRENSSSCCKPRQDRVNSTPSLNVRQSLKQAETYSPFQLLGLLLNGSVRVCSSSFGRDSIQHLTPQTHEVRALSQQRKPPGIPDMPIFTTHTRISEVYDAVDSCGIWDHDTGNYVVYQAKSTHTLISPCVW